VEAYLAGDPVSFSGKRVRFPDTFFSVRTLQKRPAIYVAGMAGDPETTKRAVTRGYVPFFTTGWNKLEAIAQLRGKVAQAYASAGGDVPAMPFALQRYVFVTDDPKAALRAADGVRYVRRIAQAMRGNYGELDGSYLKEMPAADEPPLEEIVDRLLIGDAETVTEKLSSEIDALNPTHISCFMGIPGLPQNAIMKSIEEFGAKVLPAIGKHLGPSADTGISRRAVA
ncbi:MAG: LLM class flavin-dependent oxidoreductase, partial [Bradyrhizobium sp.]